MQTASARYLVPFHTKHVPHFFTDVLIVGSGLAGLRAALAVDPSLSVVVIAKQGVEDSNSVQAQGGIAATLDPADSFEDHISDTLRAGGSLCDEAVVAQVIREAPVHIEELIRWGVKFDQEGDRLALAREGGHGRQRIAHALGDASGKEIMRAMIHQVRSAPNINIWTNTFTLDLLTVEGVCRGALVWNERHGKTMVWAKQTILATGGAGQLYRETTNPPVATADGMALAYRAGAELRDLEFMQFHPTVLYIAGGSRSLISEAVRGEGAWLVDRHGQRFMPEYDPRAELAPRDVVSLAIVDQMEKTRHPNVFLDLNHLDPAKVRERFPSIAAVCAEFNLDITRDRIPVRPGAHYIMGGVSVNIEGRTTLPRLWAAGEVAASGFHGANRLASNSLLEAVVFGAHAGRGGPAQLRAHHDLAGEAGRLGGGWAGAQQRLEFFDRQEQQERAQPWGFTLPFHGLTARPTTALLTVKLKITNWATACGGSRYPSTSRASSRLWPRGWRLNRPGESGERLPRGGLGRSSADPPGNGAARGSAWHGYPCRWRRSFWRCSGPSPGLSGSTGSNRSRPVPLRSLRRRLRPWPMRRR